MAEQNGNQNGDGPTPPPICKRCNTNPSVINLRSEHMCGTCFDKYTRSKCIKRTETYRVRYNPPDTDTTPRRLLLPLSFGISSITLLHLLNAQLQTQLERTSRTGFVLLVMYVDESAIDPSVPTGDTSIRAVQARFPDVGEYMVAKLEGIYEFSHAVKSFEMGAAATPQQHTDWEGRLKELIAALPTPSSRMDVLQILRTRLMVELARKHACEAVLWGDTTTRLAEKTLAETAKGRGFSIPWQTADGESPFGVKFLYPLRDLLKKEVAVYVSLDLPTPLRPLCFAVPQEGEGEEGEGGRKKYAAVGKGITIDELMTQYFEGIEGQYPSIVANVVRTAGKLVTEGGVVRIGRCKICGLPRDGGGGELVLDAETKLGESSNREANGNGHGEKKEGSDMCYGCARSVHGAKTYEWPL
ncbi:hypothetical protein L873DRAFT_1766628 [Choiromyces venosus 120613-1]|uniref:Cytoplasmic tRNA 2-thiolation protein 2 n=1 Tax=Choiromyces venosus 120613-1 TaxID=1336337 RepID=A0A3N4JV67_9PEZI|nr:hypothetical protein L873DRAFT_1766628 [Choiromyces venosus 120613-1]